MPKAPIRILIVAALCVLTLIGLVVRESMARASGTEVLLAMEAVDPRALLSGHYVIVALRDQISAEDACWSEQSREPWLGLAPSDETAGGATIYELAAESSAPVFSVSEPGVIAVRGSFICNPPLPAAGDFVGAPGTISLDLGISRFHINQSDAERIDRMLRMQTSGGVQRIFAIVSIGQDGRARLKGLQVDGERLELNWL